MRFITLGLISLAFVVYMITFGGEGMESAGFLFPFTMSPYLVVAWFAWSWRSMGSQIVCFVAAVAYSAWFALVYLDATVWRPDAQSAIGVLFVGVFAAPILFALWLIAYAFEWRSRADAQVCERD